MRTANEDANKPKRIKGKYTVEIEWALQIWRMESRRNCTVQ